MSMIDGVELKMDTYIDITNINTVASNSTGLEI